VEQPERTLRLTVEYDGAGFHGWARQPGLRTVQEALEQAVGCVFRDAHGLAVAGRTDTGVHATGQVASLIVRGGPPADRTPPALNQHLPPDVAVVSCVDAPPGFHARFSARGRAYEYRLLRTDVRHPLRAARCYHVPYRLDEDALDACCAALLGEHDFRAFTPSETQHAVFLREVLDAAWRHHGDESVLAIAADSFLRHMVRTLVGSMLIVARGGMTLARFEALLAGAERGEAGPTAPPHALCLVRVLY
jgi:tRNA pseudouridine38-40 synthase